jgi:hypothetical protein
MKLATILASKNRPGEHPAYQDALFETSQLIMTCLKTGGRNEGKKRASVQDSAP